MLELAAAGRGLTVDGALGVQITVVLPDVKAQVTRFLADHQAELVTEAGKALEAEFARLDLPALLRQHVAQALRAELDAALRRAVGDAVHEATRLIGPTLRERVDAMAREGLQRVLEAPEPKAPF